MTKELKKNKGNKKQKNIFVQAWKKFKEYIKNLKPLVLMQLKDKIELGQIKSKKKLLFKSVYSILRFTLVTALIYVLFTLIVDFGIFSFLKTMNLNI